jgi:Ca2+-binding RTX toxin-like protein
MFDTLESRRHLSVSFTAGRLTVTGTEGNDTIAIWYDYARRALRVLDAGVIQNFVDSAVNHITVIARGGRDTVVLNDSVRQRAALWGGEGNDSLCGGASNDQLYGQGGADTLVGNGGDDFLSGGDGDDRFDAGADSTNGADQFIGGLGRDTVSYESRSGGVGVSVSVNNLPDDGIHPGAHGGSRERDNVRSDVEVVIGTRYADTMVGNNLPNTFRGGGGMDYLAGGAGADSLYGDDESDSLYGEAGFDSLFGGAGNDSLDGGDHADSLFGDAGSDTLSGSAGADKAYGGADSDTLRGDAGNDTLFGELGSDLLEGGPDADNLYGGSEDDTLRGNDGNDGLFGGHGRDRLSGENGFDRLLMRHGDFDATRSPGDAQVHFVDGPRRWSDQEIVSVDQGLAWLHAATGNTRLLRLKNGNAMTFQRFGTLPRGAWADNDSLGHVRFSDAGLVSDVAATVVHEIGHNWDDENDRWNAFKGLSGWGEWAVDQPVPVGYTRGRSEPGEPPSPWIYLTGSQFPSDYARTNPYEDFAESLREYHQGTAGFVGTAKWSFVHAFVTGLRY